MPTIRLKLKIGNREYGEDELISVATEGGIFGNEVPSVGNAVAREIIVDMGVPDEQIPLGERMELYIDYGTGWQPRGVFYIDTREKKRTESGVESTMHIEGADALLKGSQDFTGFSFPMTDAQCVATICSAIGVESAWAPDMGYQITQPDEDQTMRSVLGYIAAMYAGNVIINDEGKLELIPLGGAGDGL